MSIPECNFEAQRVVSLREPQPAQPCAQTSYPGFDPGPLKEVLRRNPELNIALTEAIRRYVESKSPSDA